MEQKLTHEFFGIPDLELQLVEDPQLIPLCDRSVKDNPIMVHGHDSSGCFLMKKLPAAE